MLLLCSVDLCCVVWGCCVYVVVPLMRLVRVLWGNGAFCWLFHCVAYVILWFSVCFMLCCMTVALLCCCASVLLCCRLLVAQLCCCADVSL